MKALLDQLDALPPGDAVFDLDNTLLVGDIGEATLRRLLHRLPPKAASQLGTTDPWAAYEALAARDWCGAGDVAAQALAGLSPAEVEAIAAEVLERGEVRLNPHTVELAQALSRRHRVWILTGSAELLGRVAAARMGIERVVGMRLREVDGRLSDELLPPCTCGEGKVLATRQLISERPVFAIGDSPTDLPILRMATVARTLGKIAGREFPALEK
ncbi:HAD family hydrolase [Archangium sp.]|jgi:phosphoserine phosphatase|uniref:HAD family hydrolase n=1 Tax=Archangium sp. TaxID=1872627 RepID=UPI002EDAF642